ncbi:hypothetical protein [Naasia sp. SYSU D00057]|uniref:hypothetical protein n=1 Tax=Naasia sp. SYSU D00057 TaxID=2817380 RepID=UPI001B311543|nr:hypothetical protein [Naasia sp. SYSU D00057]
MTRSPAASASRAARTLRGVLAVGLAVHVAAFFHVSGGGAAPAPVAVALTLVFAAPVAIVLAGRRLTAPRIAAIVAVSQVLLHVLFTLSPSSAPGAGPGGHVHGGHLHGSALALPVVDGVVPPMWQAHALAALVTTAALLLGARALGAAERVGRLAIRRLVAVLRAPAPVVLLSSPVPAAEVPPLHDRLAGMLALRHRGPPILPVRPL